jgi:hypothetical protein
MTRLDHVVFAVKDLDAAAAKFRRAGFSVVAGGRHVAHGVANMLIGLADGTYLELFCFVEKEKAPPDHAMMPLWLAGEGLAIYWLATTQLDADVARLAELHVPYSAPQELARTKPDGTDVRFRIATPSEPRARCFPFLIEDITPRAERLPAEHEHENGARTIAAIELDVPDTSVADAYASFLRQSPAAENGTWTFAISGARIVLKVSGLPPATFAGLAPRIAWGPARLRLASGDANFLEKLSVLRRFSVGT